MEDVSYRVGQMSRSPGIQLFPSSNYRTPLNSNFSTFTRYLDSVDPREKPFITYPVIADLAGDTHTHTHTHVHQRDTSDAWNNTSARRVELMCLITKSALFWKESASTPSKTKRRKKKEKHSETDTVPGYWNVRRRGNDTLKWHGISSINVRSLPRRNWRFWNETRFNAS